jgi:hypothetical protein
MYVFPPAFQVITSYFYAAFGFYGLYILPMLSTVLLWIATGWFLHRMGVGARRIALALFILVFCSPLTVYAAMYWEHTTSVLLLFGGAVFLLLVPRQRTIAFLLALACGAAIWLRPEALVLDFLFVCMAIVLFRRSHEVSCLFFIGGIALCAGSFLVFNKLEYGSFLGVHANQILVDKARENEYTGLRRVAYIFSSVNHLLVSYFFFVLLLFPLIYLFRRSKDPLDRRIMMLAVVVLAFCVITPIILPNNGGRQWGPRYYLPLIPIILVILFLADRQRDFLSPGRMPRWLAGGLLLLTLLTCWRNTYTGGVRHMQWAYGGRVQPFIDRIDREPGHVVVISNPYIAYELGYLVGKAHFFMASGDDSLRHLLPLLKAQGVQRYIYIFNPHEPKSQPPMLRDSSTQRLWILARKWRDMTDDFYAKEYLLQ